jgi:hypothetical protein
MRDQTEVRVGQVWRTELDGFFLIVAKDRHNQICTVVNIDEFYERVNFPFTIGAQYIANEFELLI